MPDYDFQPLSSYDFEILTRDLIQEEFAVRLESFAPGRDGGIDFRFKTATGDLIVQCKHYKSEYSRLYRTLKRDEAPKVRRLKPSRYVLAVSTPLTPRRKADIQALLEPYCQTPADIIGREDLNNLLGRHSEIERKHFKLWLTSHSVLTRLLEGGIWGDSELTLQRIKKRTSRYVENPSFYRAREILDKFHYCIIAGIPGIGKTTLAEILLIEYVDRHGFQAVRIANDLSEIKGIKNPHKRLIFYFDDFLGKTTLDKLQKNEDQRLMEFLEEVRENENWRFLLTTREYILNAAKVRYEAFAHPPVDLKPSIVDLADYTRPIRARILYNHIFFSDLPDAYKRALLTKGRYERIIAHQNYNPRIIDHMTLQQHVVVDSDAYFKSFIDNLDNPLRIWDHAFRNQLSESARHLLLTMSISPNEILIADLESAFNSYYQYRRTKLGFNTSSRDFDHALKELDGNFIKSTLVGDSPIISFHNPSVGDFLESYLAVSPGEVADLIDGAVFFDQFVRLWRGQRGMRFAGIDRHSQKFICALANGFSAPTCRIIRMGAARGNAIGVRHFDWSIEARATFVLEVAEGLATADARDAADQVLAIVSKRVGTGQADKGDLVRLLQILTPKKPETQRQHPLFDNISRYFTDTLEDFEDFDSASQLLAVFPELVSPAEASTIRGEFPQFCKGYVDVWERDPDMLRSIAEDITTIGKRLAVDIASFSEPLFQRADEIEGEREQSEPTEDDEDLWRGQVQADQDTDRMFLALLNEVTERSSDTSP